MSTSPAETPIIQLIRRVQIFPSPELNARKTFNESKISELADSFREQGFNPSLSHLLIRRIKEEIRVEPSGEEFIVQRETPEGWETLHVEKTEDRAWEQAAASVRFELICGERRWRAASVVGLEYVPAVVSTAENKEALELSLIENLQRDDLTPLEEAQGYRRLLDERDAEGKPVHTAQSLARRVSRSEMHIHQRLSLIVLNGTPAGEAMLAGVLPPNSALLIARLATPALREELTQLVLNNPYGPSPMPSPQIEQIVQERFQRQLRGSKFNLADPDLVPVRLDAAGNRLAGGSCEDCPFNIAKQESSRKFRICTNPECHAEKERANYDKWAVESSQHGVTVLPKTENDGLWDFNEAVLSPSAAAQYADLDTAPSAHDLVPGTENAAPWKTLLAGQDVPVVLARDGKDREHRLVPKEMAVAAARQNGHDIFRAAGKKKRTIEDVQVVAAQKKQGDEREERIREAEFDALHIGYSEVREISDALWLALMPWLTVAPDEAAVARLAGEADFVKRIKGVVKEQRLGVLLELLIGYPAKAEGISPALAKALGVDLKKVRKTYEAAFKAEDKAAAEEKGVAEGMRWNSERTKAADFEWNEHNVCPAPDLCELDMPDKVTAILKVAKDDKGWFSSVEMVAPGMGMKAALPSRTHTAYSSRKLAVRAALQEVELSLRPLSVPAALDRVRKYLILAASPAKKEAANTKKPAKKRAAKKAKKA